MISENNFTIMRPQKPLGAQPEIIGAGHGHPEDISWVFDSGPRGTQLRFRRPADGGDTVISGPVYLTSIAEAMKWVEQHLTLSPAQGELRP